MLNMTDWMILNSNRQSSNSIMQGISDALRSFQTIPFFGKLLGLNRFSENHPDRMKTWQSIARR